MVYKHLICKCKNSFAFTDFQFTNLVAIFTKIVKLFGGKAQYEAAIKELEANIYELEVS